MPAALDLVLGGWQTNGIVTFAQGQFQTLAARLGLDPGRQLLAIASRTSSAIPSPGASCPTRIWNPAAFDFPRDAQGNRHPRGRATPGATRIQQPGINNWDIGLFKNFRIPRRFNAQFRWETFNTWNHTQFGSANTNTQSPTFGAITSTRVGPRRMQFGLRATF